MKCFIEQIVAQKLKYYVGSVNAEISGIGKSEIIDGDIYVKDIMIFKQKCTGAHTDICSQDQARAIYQMTNRGDDLKNWNIWWHSHNTMGVFWSPTDDATIKEHANNGSYLISIVTNKEGKYKTRVDLFPKDVSPFNIVTNCKAFDDVETSILPNNFDIQRKDELDDILSLATKEMEEKIEKINADHDALLSSIQDEYGIMYGDAELEYENLSESDIVDNPTLKEQIELEVKEKVEVPEPIYSGSKRLLKYNYVKEEVNDKKKYLDYTGSYYAYDMHCADVESCGGKCFGCKYNKQDADEIDFNGGFNI